MFNLIDLVLHCSILSYFAGDESDQQSDTGVLGTEPEGKTAHFASEKDTVPASQISTASV